jgi:hypothetical protein
MATAEEKARGKELKGEKVRYWDKLDGKIYFPVEGTLTGVVEWDGGCIIKHDSDVYERWVLGLNRFYFKL